LAGQAGWKNAPTKSSRNNNKKTKMLFYSRVAWCCERLAVSHAQLSSSRQTRSAMSTADEIDRLFTLLLSSYRALLTAGLVPAPYTTISVEGKSTDEICGEIMGGLPQGEGSVIVLVGLSGTGKGTTVARLSELLPKAVTWSNGNVFRSLTLLAVKWCEAQGLPAFDAGAALTPANLADFMSMLSFGRRAGGGGGEEEAPFDIRIEGLGVSADVSAIANTDLKAPAVGRNIPTVANVTQGEVVGFVAKATAMMSAAGCNVIIEGREATINHIPTPHRFALTLKDPATIGRRRAAQRIAAAVLKELTAAGTLGEATPESIDAALKATATALAAAQA
jgi:hypothetical protein